MQNTSINQNLIPLYTALGIAAYNGCINAQDLINSRPEMLYSSIEETISKFLTHFQYYKIHLFYCQRDEQVFEFEQDTVTALWDSAIDPEGTMPPLYFDLTEDQIWDMFLAKEPDPTTAWFDYLDPKTQIPHHIVCILDI